MIGSGADSASVTNLFLIVLFTIFHVHFLALPSPGMENLSNHQMSQVTGREGLAVDINLDASVNNLQFRDQNGYQNSGNTGHLILNNLTLNGGGSPADLLGLTVDADANQGLVVGAPQGTFAASLFNACLNNAPSSNCGGRTTGPASFGEFNAQGVSLVNSEIRIEGKNDGITADMDFNLTANSLEYTDHNGASSGNPGSISINNFHAGDRTTANGASTLEGLSVDADQNRGLVLGLPSSPSSEPGLEADNFMLPSSGSNVGSFWLDNFNFGSAELHLGGNNDGLDVGGALYFQADAFRIEDSDDFGHLQLGSGSNGLQIHDGSGSPVSFSGFTIDFEGQNWIVFHPPSSPSFHLDADEVQLGTSTSAMSLNINALKFGFSSSNETIVRVNGTGEGITSNIELEMNVNSIDLIDPDGIPSDQDDGAIRLGGNDNIDIGEGGSTNSPAQLTGLNVDVDPNNGAVVDLPSGSIGFHIDGVQPGDPVTGSYGTSLFSIRTSVNFNNSTLQFRGLGDGLEVDGGINFTAPELALIDGDGYTDKNGTNRSGGDIRLQGLVLDDASGGALSFSSPATINADSVSGLRIEAPGFPSSGNPSSPDNRLEIELIGTGADSCSGTCPSWRFQNINPSGSWMEVEGL